MHIDGVKVIALCNMQEINIAEVQQILIDNNLEKATAYTSSDGWRKICERTDIDLVYVCTDRKMHTPIAVYAMQHDKHVAIEVPAANTLEEC